MANKAQELIDTLIENELSEQKGEAPKKAKPVAAPKKVKEKEKTESRKKADKIVNQALADSGVGLRPRHSAMGAEEYQEYSKSFDEQIEADREPGLGEAALKGITAGTIGIAEDVGTVTKYLGGKFKSPTMVEIGDTAEKYWANVKEEYEAPESLQGDIVMPDGSINTELLTKGSWWAYHVAQMVPSLAVSILPAAATVRGVATVGAGLKTVGTGANAYKAINVGKNVIKVKPATIDRLARIGGAIAGGAAGGALEGSGTHREVLERGGTPEEAAAAAEMMFFASAGLNAISLDFMFKNLPNSAKGRLFKRFLNGAMEGVTEYLEGPAEAKILLEGAKGGSYEFTPEEFGDKIRQEANVFGPAFVLGMIMPVGALKASPKKKGEGDKKPPKPEIKPDEPTGIVVTDEDGETIELSEADEALKEEFDLLSTGTEGISVDETAEEITMEASPEEDLALAQEEYERWGNAFDPAEYGEGWSQDDKDTFDLLNEAADYNPAVVDEVARMAETGISTTDINDLLIQTIKEGYNARLQEAQGQQQGQAGSGQVSGEPGAGLQPAGVPAGAGPITTGGPQAAGPEGIGEQGDRPTEPIEEPEPAPVEGEMPVDELTALADEELEAELADAELEEELEVVEEPDEAAIEDLSDEDIDALLTDAGEEAAEPEPEKPETTGPSTGKPVKAEPEPEKVEPEYEDVKAEPEPEKVEEEPKPEDTGRKYAEDEYAKLKGKDVEVTLQYDDGEAEVKTMKADEAIKDVDDRITALEAFKECMAA